MFRHCVLIRFRDDASAEQRRAARDAVLGLPALIPEIAHYSAGFDAGLRDDNFDMAVVGDFASRADYERYATHPDHVEVIQTMLAPIIAVRAAVQFES